MEEKATKEEREEKQIKMFHRFADISLRTSATTLTILFAYTFASEGLMSASLKTVITFVAGSLLASIFSAIFCLMGLNPEELRFVRIFSLLSTVIMAIGLTVAFGLLFGKLWVLSG